MGTLGPKYLIHGYLNPLGPRKAPIVQAGGCSSSPHQRPFQQSQTGPGSMTKTLQVHLALIHGKSSTSWKETMEDFAGAMFA